MSASPTADIGAEMHELLTRLYPICRSITGDGVRETLQVLAERIPLTIHEVPTGTPVLDWTVPREWNIRDAWVAGADGRRVIDFRRHNLHVMGYSIPVRERISLRELRPHLHTLPDRPALVPWVTSYYQDAWGFSLAQEQLDALPEGEYDVVIDSDLRDGSLTYAECLLPGTQDDEVLISAHVCHPSLANDNLSGVVVAAYLAHALAEAPHRYTYRFVFAPGTIGAITWLARNEDVVPRIRHGLVLTGVGDAGSLTYKQTRAGDTEIDRAMAHLLADPTQPGTVVPFSPWGYDERQYGSPGFDLPVGCLMRTPHGTYPEYHTSGDDPSFVRPASLAGTLAACRSLVDVLERNRTCVNLSPKGEPQLGRRGLYPSIGGGPAGPDRMAVLWVLNQSDGTRSLLDIASRSGLPFDQIAGAADALEAVGLLAVTGS